MTKAEYRALVHEWYDAVVHHAGELWEDRLVDMLEKKDYRVIPSLGNSPVPSEVPTAEVALPMLYDVIPDDVKYYLTLDVHIQARHPLPFWLILNLETVRPDCYLDELPDEVIGTDRLTVYRGSMADSADEATAEYSWTLSKEVALFFCGRYLASKHRPHLYVATIYKEDILAYTNDRSEFEIIQFNHVRDVTEIEILPDELAEVERKHQENWRQTLAALRQGSD